MQDQQTAGLVPRHLSQIVIERIEDRPDEVHIHAKVDTTEAVRPACQTARSLCT
jgi:hypothetical protein